MPTNGSKRSIADISPDVIVLKPRLRSMEPGDVVTYAELSELIQNDVQRVRRSALQRARLILMREDMIVFGVIRSVGLQRLSDSEVARLWPSVVRHVRRSAKRGMRRHACVKSRDALTPEEKTSFDIGSGILGLLYHETQPRRVKRLEDATQQRATALPTSEMLELLKK